MRFVLFVQSIISDWNHGNAHFLRGIGTELIRRGHEVIFYEPYDSWSYLNFLKEGGSEAAESFFAYFPQIKSIRYEQSTLDLDHVLGDADVVIVHEWNDHELVKKVGFYRKFNPHFKLFFHDTHHRAVTSPQSMQKYDLSNYDGALVFGEILKTIYEKNNWVNRVWVWHEAADTWVFRPFEDEEKKSDIVWIGNWGDEERSEELREFLFEPLYELNLRGRIYGVRYPEDALHYLQERGIDYRGWIANYRVPHIFSQYKLTVHVPRRPYVKALPGIPTIRVFEALASGIPLLCSYWDDCEHLFTKEDFLMAENGEQMKKNMKDLINDSELAKDLIVHGRETVLNHHTCRHRVNQLFEIISDLGKHSCNCNQFQETLSDGERGEQ
ncbi:MAG: glycosyltransferase [Fibrobacter sp.]|nr:glycosyltransferase [Fibrobacter sp.]